MNIKLKKISRLLLIGGAIFIAYGFLAIRIPVYFFWESKIIGWWFLSLGLIGFITIDFYNRKEKRQKVFWNKIGIGFFALILFIQLVLMISIPNLDAYKISKDYLRKNKRIIDEVGNVKSFRHLPLGGVQYTSNSDGERISATINLLIKGDKAYKVVTVFMVKEYGLSWKITGIDED